MPSFHRNKSRHPGENKERRAPCPAPVEAAGNELCNSGSANGGAPKIDVGAPSPVEHQLAQ
eukprot:9493295-Pyramimonas_sp.AAC.1